MNRLLLRSTILNLLIFIIASTALGQPPSIRFQHLSAEHGLSHDQVLAITQDNHGFMWIATTNGLNRFDGYKVEIFRNRIGDSTSLPSNGILYLFTDTRGIVWIGTSNGLAYYDERTNSFRTFYYDSTNKNSLAGKLVNVINEDSRGLLWIGTPQGLCSFNTKTNRFQRFVNDKHSKNSISSDLVNDIKFGPDGSMWISTHKGLNRLDLATMKFTSFFHDPNDTTSLLGNSVSRIVIDKKGKLWTFLRGKLSLECFDTKTYRTKHFRNLFERLSLNGANYLQFLFIDKTGRLWAGSTQSGLCLLYPDRNILYQYKTDPFDAESLQSNTITRMYQDRSGMIWLGTFNAGVERFNPDESKFILYRLHSDQIRSFEKKSVQTIAEDSSYRLWIGTSDGISILDRNTGTFTDYHWKQGDSNLLSVNLISAICRDKRGNMWVGTQYGLNLFESGRNSFRSFYAENNNQSLADNVISNIICDKNGDLIINSKQAGGATIFNSKTKQFRNFKNDSTYAALALQIEVFFEDKRGTLWVGTRNYGLIRWDRSSGKFEIFIKKANDTTSLPADHIGSITQDNKGIIWIGTGGGLCYFNEHNRTFKTFTDKDGLPDVRVRQLLVDDKDRIWMSTNRGISMLNESRTAFTNYDPTDGLQGWVFSEPSAFKTHDGYFCYGGSNGFNMFHPDSIKKNSFVPPVMLTRITLFDKPLKMDSSLASLKSLKLSYKQNFFSFEFAALNYDHPEKNQYAYQLIPFDKQMRQLGTNRTISYTNVPPGKYALKVMASNNDDIWNEAGYELKLVIVPPFWATWWFRSIVVIVLIGAILLFIKRRETRIKKEQAHQTAMNKQIAEIRMTALQAQMNPHFIFNSLNSIQHLISIHEKEEAIAYLSKFSKLVRQILENSRENTVSISSELKLLEPYIQLEQLRFNHKFDYHISVDEKIDRENTLIPPLLIQPYVENAILHGLVSKDGKGHLWLSMEMNDGTLVCRVEDNGIGRSKALDIGQKKDVKHRSLGIKVTDERISILSALLEHKAEVSIEDLFETKQVSEGTPQAAGTRVTIAIPLRVEEG